MNCVWLVEYCPCVYESAPEVVSVHESAVGAFNSMRRCRDSRSDRETWEALKYLGYMLSPEVSGNKPRSYKGDKNDWWYRIRKVEVI